MPAFAESLLRFKADEQVGAFQHVQIPASPAVGSKLLYEPYDTPPRPKRPLQPRGLSDYSASNSGSIREFRDDVSPRILSAGDLSLLTLDGDLGAEGNLLSPKGKEDLSFSPSPKKGKDAVGL